jgi:hypothetical protein
VFLRTLRSLKDFGLEKNNTFVLYNKILIENKMSTTEIKLYDIFRKDLKLSDEKAKIFAEIVQETVINEVRHQQTEFKSQNKEDLLKLEMQLASKIEQLNVKIESTKVDLVKWFVGLFFALALMIIGLYIKK